MKEVKPPKKPIIFYYLLALVALLLLNAFLFPSLTRGTIKEVNYSEFLQMLRDGQVQEVQVEQDVILFVDNAERPQIYEVGRMEDPELVDRLEEAKSQYGLEYGQVVVEEMSPLMSFLLTWVLPIVLMVLLGQLLTRLMLKKMGTGGVGGPAMTFGKSNAKVYVPSTTGIKFADVAGEANVPFFSISGSEFVEMFVGMGAAKVRDLFKQAAEKAPCIVFIDEIDTIGKKRDGASGIGGNDEREQTLNQLLTEMDGFDTTKGVIILAATNRPESLDPALLRPGRFDRRVPVELPDLKGREDILRVHAAKVRHAPNLDFSAIARAAAGASGAELANIVNEAALRAVRQGRSEVIQSDMEESVEVVIAGYQKKNQILSDKEKLIVAYHETGHALVAALQSHSAPVHKITIIPRTSGALGYTMQVDEGEHYLMSKEELENRISTLTGGRVAEDLVFHSITTGASNDIEQATKLARAMLAQYGMSEEFGMVALQTQSNLYLGGDASLACSPETAAEIDRRVIELVRRQYEKAQNLLRENMPRLHQLAKFLYEKETITGEEFMEILNQPVPKLQAPEA